MNADFSLRTNRDFFAANEFLSSEGWGRVCRVEINKQSDTDTRAQSPITT